MSPEARQPASGTKPHLVCPKCLQPSMRRVSRHGFLQMKVYPFFGLYPWECFHCRIIKLFKNRGVRRTKARRVDEPA